MAHRSPRACWIALASACGGQPASLPAKGTEGGSTTKAPTDPTTSTTATAPTTGASTTATATTSSSSASADTTTTTGLTSSGGGVSTSTGPVGCAKNVVLMGYWPPTNEMLRPWSTNPAQNPDGWMGENWAGYGFDVYSFFPEFPPDGDPTNDAIGEDGSVGSPDYELRVDYQATSADFWLLVDVYQPVILVTTSRGGGIGWEIEALEGGHGMGNDQGPAFDWSSDQHGADQFPTEESIHVRSWDAISTYRQGTTLPSQLPMDAIFDATSVLGLTDVAIDQGTSGNFLSGFLGLHGVYYNSEAPHNVAAGHIHVGFGTPVADASALIEATLHAVLAEFPADGLACP